MRTCHNKNIDTTVRRTVDLNGGFSAPATQPPPTAQPVPSLPPAFPQHPAQTVVFPPPPPPPVNPNPQIITTGPVYDDQSSFDGDIPAGPSAVKTAAVLAALLLFLFVGAGGAAASVAYGWVNLNYPVIEEPVTKVVMSIPFLPKTPKYVLNQTVLAEQQVRKKSVDLSVSAKTPIFGQILGGAQIDAQIQGNVDPSGQGKSKFSLAASVANNLFSARMRQSGPKFYFKIDKVPDVLLASKGIDKAQVASLFDYWVVADASGLDTDASQLINSAGKNPTAQKKFNDFLAKDVLPQLEMSKDSSLGFDAYKFHLSPSDQLINQFVVLSGQLKGGSDLPQELRVNQFNAAQVFKNVNINFWVDTQTYFVRKITLIVQLNPNVANPAVPTKVLGVSIGPGINRLVAGIPGVSSLENSSIDIAAVLKLDDFGKDFEVAVPDKTIDAAQFAQELMSSSPVYRQILNSGRQGGDGSGMSKLRGSLPPNAQRSPQNPVPL